MCGIVYAQSFNGTPVGPRVWEQYEKQKMRGTEGFGLFDGKYTTKAAMEKRIKRWFKRDSDATMLLFHHRFPTSTINVKRAAHPFNTGNHFGKTRYVLVHNGVISNAKDLKPEHEKLGIKYQSVLQDGKFNDSEALLWDMALTLEGKQDDMKAYGGIAFVCIKMVDDKPVTMFFGRNMGRPLNLERTKEGIMLSSEGPGTSINEGRLYTYNYELKRLTDKFFRIPAYKPYNNTWDSTTARYNPNRSYGYDGRGYSSREANTNGWDDGSWESDNEWFDRYYEKRYGAGSNKYTPKKPVQIGEVVKFTASEQRVNAKMMQLLSANNGSFYQAYTQAQEEYDIIDFLPQPTADEIREMGELLQVSDALENDKDWETIDSIHHYWKKKDKEERATLSLAMALNAAAGSI